MIARTPGNDRVRARGDPCAAVPDIGRTVAAVPGAKRTRGAAIPAGRSRRIAPMATAVVDGPDAVAGPPTRRRDHRALPGWVTLVVWFGFVAGFVVALVALARPRWFPILDLAQTEMRLRDVFSAHPPLIGLPGRIGSFRHQGSHPGPLSFWVLAPLYEVFGASAWAMQAATAALNAVALGVALLMGRRRGGTTLFLGVGAVLAVLTYFYGPSVLTQAWNPYLPILWFVVFALGVWSVLCDDLAMLPVAAFAGCFCLQTHISYLGLVAGLGGVALVWTGWSLVRRPEALDDRRWWWISLAAAIVLLTAIPPIVQELTNNEGNLTLIWRHFTNPPEDPIGIADGARILLVHLNPWRLVTGQDATTGSIAPGVALLLAWGASVVVAVRARARSLISLDVVLAGVLVLGVISIANIFGFVWYYLMLWAWQLNALLVFTTVWAVVLVVRGADPGHPTRRRFGTAVLAVVMVGYLTGFAVDASTVEPPTPRVSTSVGLLAGATIRAIDSGKYVGGGHDGTYQVTIVDTVTINAPGYTMVNELERVGIRAGFPDNVAYRAIVTPRRIVTRDEATAVVHYAVGDPDIVKWRSLPGVTMIARHDPRTGAEQREAARLVRRVRRQMRAAGRADLIPDLEANIFTTSLTPGLPRPLQRNLLRLLDLGRPNAVFVGPPDLAE